jgi:mercuric ion transport protein
MKLKNLISAIVLIILVLTMSSCGGGRKADKETVVTEASKVEVSIGGMTCTGCEQTVQSCVAKLDGVKSVKASFTTGNAVIEYIPGKVDSLKIKEAINGSGYSVKKFSAVQQEEPSK